MSVLEEMIAESGLEFLSRIDFEEPTPGRFFQKRKVNIGNGLVQFYVVLGPNIESPVHNHAGQNMTETHLLLHGSGEFVIYDQQGEPEREVELVRGIFHEKFSTATQTPDHKYIAGPQGSICLASEEYS